jgi:hypothetical protein
MSSRIFAPIIAFSLLICNFAFGNWHLDFEEAREKAKQEQKPLLITFVGPNWCPHSDQIEEEILSDVKWQAAAEREAILVRIEIPEEFSEETYPGKEIQEKFAVEECPAIVLVEPSGEEISKLTFLPISAKELLKTIHTTLEDYQNVCRLTKGQLEALKIEELKALYAKAEHLADTTLKQNVLNQGLKKDPSPHFLLEQYSNLLTSGKLNMWKKHTIRKKIVERDPDNTEGALRKLAVLDFEALASVKRPKKADAVVAPLIKYLQEFSSSDRKGAWEIEMKISQYFFSQNQIEQALVHAKSSYALAPEEVKEEIAMSINYLNQK